MSTFRINSLLSLIRGTEFWVLLKFGHVHHGPSLCDAGFVFVGFKCAFD